MTRLHNSSSLVTRKKKRALRKLILTTLFFSSSVIFRFELLPKVQKKFSLVFLEKFYTYWEAILDLLISLANMTFIWFDFEELEVYEIQFVPKRARTLVLSFSLISIRPSSACKYSLFLHWQGFAKCSNFDESMNTLCMKHGICV